MRGIKLLIIPIILLLLVTVVVADNLEDIQEGTEGDVREIRQSFQNTLSSTNPGSSTNTGSTSITVENNGGIQSGTFPPGSTASRASDGTTTATAMDNVVTDSGVSASNARDITIRSDGGVRAGSATEITVPSGVSAGNAQNIEVSNDGNTVTAAQASSFGVPGEFNANNVRDARYSTSPSGGRQLSYSSSDWFRNNFPLFSSGRSSDGSFVFDKKPESGSTRTSGPIRDFSMTLAGPQTIEMENPLIKKKNLFPDIEHPRPTWDFSKSRIGKDTDNDGLNDDFELKYGFDTRKKDSDGDGTNDYNEVIASPEKYDIPMLAPAGSRDAIVEIAGNSGDVINGKIRDNVFELAVTNPDSLDPISILFKSADGLVSLNFTQSDPSKQMSVVMKKKADGSFGIEAINADAIIESRYAKEFFKGAGKASIESFDYETGVHTAGMSRRTTYYYESKLNSNMDFAIKSPDIGYGKDIYSLVFDKVGHSQERGSADAYISLATNTLMLDGIVTYLRKSDIDGTYYPIYEGLQDKNILTLKLASDSIGVQEISLVNPSVVCTKASIMPVANIYSGELWLEERCMDGEVQTLGDYVPNARPWVIQGNYTAEFNGKKEPVMVFDQKAVVQPDQELSLSHTIFTIDEGSYFEKIKTQVVNYLENLKKECGWLEEE